MMLPRPLEAEKEVALLCATLLRLLCSVWWNVDPLLWISAIVSLLMDSLRITSSSSAASRNNTS